MRVFLWYERYARLLDWMDANWFKGEFPNGAGNWRLHSPSLVLRRTVRLPPLQGQPQPLRQEL